MAGIINTGTLWNSIFGTFDGPVAPKSLTKQIPSSNPTIFSSPSSSTTAAASGPSTIGNFLTSSGGFMFLAFLAVGAIIGVTYVKGAELTSLASYTGAFIGLAIFVYATVFMSQKTDRPSSFSPVAVFRMLYYFLPYGLVTYTTLSDLFNQEYKYVGGIVTGVITFILNRTISYFITGKGMDLSDSNYCGVPGLGKFGSNFLPQAMLFNLSVLSYIAALITLDTEFNNKYTIPVWTFLVSVFLGSSYTTIKSDCFDSTKGHSYLISEAIHNNGQGSKTLGITFTLLATLVASLGAGWLGAFVQHYYIPTGGLSSGSKLDPKQSVSPTQAEKVINVSSTPGDTIDASQIVAEIYQNGKQIGGSLLK